MKKDLGIINKNNCVLLVIDVQEAFEKVIHDFGNTVRNIEKLIKVFNLLKMPIILTEQHPKGLGKTIKPINNLLKNNSKIIEKTEFSCFDNKKFSSIIKKYKIKNIIVCRIEAHICVLRTLLSGIKSNYNMHLVVDAVSSRRLTDKNIAIERAKQINVYLATTESIIFQLITSSKDSNFKKIINIVK